MSKHGSNTKTTGGAAAKSKTHPPAGGSKPGANRAARRRSSAKRSRTTMQSRRIALISIGLVVAIAAGLVVAKLVSHPAAATGTSAAPAAVVHDATHVPASTFEQVGVGSNLVAPAALPGGTPALTSGGKPQVLYIGAEYCPYCAAERWATVVALSRFGTFSGLGGTESSTTDIFPGTKTFTFHGSTFDGSDVAFKGVELQTNQPNGNGGYTALDTPTAQEQQLLRAYDIPPYSSSAGGIPFIDIGGRYVVSGATFDPSVLKGLTLEQIASRLSDPNDPVAKAIDGSANLITAAICAAANQGPAVCSSPEVKQAAAVLARSSG